MLIPKGVNSVHRLSTQLPENCKACGATDSLQVNISQEYFHLFFLPLFPLEKTMSIECVSCGNTVEYDVVPMEYRHYYDELKKQAGTPIWAFVAAFVIIAIIAAFPITAYVRKMESAKMISTLKEGDILKLQSRPAWYSMAQVTKVSGDTVFIVTSQNEVNSYGSISSLKYGFFSDEHATSVNSLKQMVDDGQIIDIERPH